MQIDKRTGTSLAALFILFTACSDDALGPGASSDALQAAEASEVALTQADLLDGMLDVEMDANPSILPATASESGLALSSVPETRSFEFTRTRDCPEGGQIVATGQVTHTADRETHTVTLELEGEKDIQDCAFVHGDIVITIDGGGTFEGFRKKVNGQFSGPQTNAQSGRFDWVTSDGREGNCTYSLTVTWNPDTHTKSIVGHVCDREIDRTVTRDRAPGDDAGGEG